jgi:aspartyl aminopeptidase
MMVCYDNEEVGSQTAQGAQSSFLRDILERMALSAEDLRIAIARSFAMSSDATHALHPNYHDKYDDHNFPVLGRGPVVKSNSNQRYATNGKGVAIVADTCDRNNINVQNFVSRSDLACGTTIGPIAAAELGICTVDVGSPLLSMHSIREVACVSDHVGMADLMKAFFNTESVEIVEE